MCGHKQISIWEISKITVVDSNDKNRGNVDCTCHQPVIYDVTVNNCYLLILPRCRIVYAHTFLTFLSNWSRDRIDSSISVSSMEDVGVKACLSR